MSDINTAYNDRVRYFLQHSSIKSKKIEEPIGWNEDDKEFARNKDYHGIFAKFSNNLKFIGEGKEFINLVRSTFGINARIRLIKEVTNNDEKWIRAYTGFLDMKTWSSENNQVSIKFNSGGLEKTLKARQNDKIELERNTNLRGENIGKLDTVKLLLESRSIFLTTTFASSLNNNKASCAVSSSGGNTRNNTTGIPIELVGQSHDLANSVLPNTNADEDNGTTGMMFYAVNDRQRVFQIDLNIGLNAIFTRYDGIQWAFLRLGLVIYENGVQYDVKRRIPLDEVSTALDTDQEYTDENNKYIPKFAFEIQNDFNKRMSTDWFGTIVLEAGESLAFEAYLKADMENTTLGSHGITCNIEDVEGYLTMKENSQYKSTLCDAISPYEAFDRVIKVLTNGDNNFKSNYFGTEEKGYPENGEGAFDLLAHGHWIRLFNSNDSLYKPFTTSFKDLFKNFMVTKNVGLGIEKFGFNEKIIIEDRKYFYNQNVTIRLGNYDSNGKFKNYIRVNNVKRSIYEDYYYSSLEIGSDKGGEYEEVMGLEETNTMSNFITSIEDGEDYQELSPYRFDPYGSEIIRRRSKETHPDTDRSGDSHIWVFEAKKSTGTVYNLKRWPDTLQSEPIGMFRPETSYNFGLSPVNILLKHGWHLNAGLREYPLAPIRFGSSKGKSSISTELIENNPLAENGNIDTTIIGKARYLPEQIEFEFPVNDFMLSLVEGYTTILGDKIMNIYGLVEFMNENNEIEKGFLLNLKPNNEGKWTLLKAVR